MRHSIWTAVLVVVAVTGCGNTQDATLREEEPELTTEAMASLSVEQAQARAAAFGVASSDLQRVRSVDLDRAGGSHTRIQQTFRGVPVFGGELVVHLDGRGALRSITDGVVRDVSVSSVVPLVSREQAIETAVQASGGWTGFMAHPETDLQVLKTGRQAALTWRVQLANTLDSTPRRPVVFVDAATGAELWRYDNLQTAKNRAVHNLGHGTSLPGVVARTEGQAPVSETDVDTNYDRLGSTWDCYSTLFGRDSYDNAGATLMSSVHYSSSYVNAYWNGTQMVYGDGDNVRARSLATSMDVTAHELTHAVTERTSGLIYSGESGGLNEAMSDIFGNICEWYRDTNGDTTKPASANNFLVGEDIWLASPALRYMADPAQDGASLDYWSPSAGNVDVHYSSGIANLAFSLLAQGGTHPRGKSSVEVTGIGIADASKIFYRLNTVYLTPSSTFSDARAGTVAAAVDLFGAGSPQAVQATNAWTAVGVAAPVSYTVLHTHPGLSGAQNSQANWAFVTPAGATAMKFDISGGTGDADLYVRFGAPPTPFEFDCRPYIGGNAESCTFNPSQAGTYYVMLVGYGSYADVTLTARYAGAAPATETSCADAIDNDADGATDCADSDCSADAACAPAGQLIINEIGANEPGSTTALEFVELVNASSQPVDVSGWTLSDALKVRHVFAAGTVVEGGKAIVVFAGPTSLVNSVTASTRALSLNNGGDTVTLANGATVVDSFTYDASLANKDGVSMNRSVDGQAGASFVLHTALGANQSPGTRADGTAY